MLVLKRLTLHCTTDQRRAQLAKSDKALWRLNSTSTGTGVGPAFRAGRQVPEPDAPQEGRQGRTRGRCIVGSVQAWNPPGQAGIAPEVDELALI